VRSGIVRRRHEAPLGGLIITAVDCLLFFPGKNHMPYWMRRAAAG